MALVKSVEVRFSTSGAEDAKLHIDELAVKAEELNHEHVTITPKVDGAKALLEAGALREGIDKEMSGAGSGNNSIFSKISGADGGGGMFAGLDNLPLGGLPALAAAVPAAQALTVELTGVVAGLAAAGAGATAFGVLAIPTFEKIKTAYTAISAAQKAYNTAVALNKADPTKANATAAALALTKLKIAEDSMGPSTKTAVTGIQGLVTSFDKMATAFRPQVMTAFNLALGIANTLLPHLKPFADVAATAIDGLLKSVAKFTTSTGFKDWIDQFSKLAGPAITAIGQGIGRVVTNFGKLITVMSSKDVVHSLNIAFDILSGTIASVTYVVGHLMKSWDELSRDMLGFAGVVGPPILRFLGTLMESFKTLLDVVLLSFQGILNGAAKAFGWIPGIGGKLKTAAADFDGYRKSVNDALDKASANLNQWANDIKNMPKIVKLQGNITDLTSKLNTAKAELKDKNLTAPQATQVKADISQLEAQIASAKRQLAALNGTSVTTYVNTTFTNIVGSPTTGYGHHAVGGMASGLTMVGENGPELIQAPPGSYVYNHAKTQAGVGAQYTININALIANQNTGRMVVEAIKQFEIRSGASWRKK